MLVVLAVLAVQHWAVVVAVLVATHGQPLTPITGGVALGVAVLVLQQVLGVQVLQTLEQQVVRQEHQVHQPRAVLVLVEI